MTEGASINVHAQHSSVVVYRLGGRQYPMTSVPQCKVCQHDDRVLIERKLIRAYGPTTIHRSLSERTQEQISVRNIMDHARRHLPTDHVVRQAIIDSRAKELGIDLDAATGTLVDGIVFAKVGLQQVYERMIDGEIRPDVSDGIAFATFLQRVEEKAGGETFDQEMMARGFMAYVSAMRKVCSADQIREISRIIADDPIMSSMLTQGERAEQQALVVQQG